MCNSIADFTPMSGVFWVDMEDDSCDDAKTIAYLAEMKIKFDFMQFQINQQKLGSEYYGQN
jgi:hypothetical protein